MASPQGSDKIRSTIKIAMYDHDPGATTAIITSADGGTTKQYLDMRDYLNFSVAAALTVPGTSGAITKLEIVASATTDFANVVVVKDSGAVDADAAGDWLIEECTAEEVAQLGTDNSAELRYVAGRLTMDAADAEASVTYIAIPRYPRKDLTPETTIA